MLERSPPQTDAEVDEEDINLFDQPSEVGKGGPKSKRGTKRTHSAVFDRLGQNPSAGGRLDRYNRNEEDDQE